MKAKEFVIEVKSKEIPKPRNFVAKNAMKTTSGAGAHKDKKKAEKQGDVKHKNKFNYKQDDWSQDFERRMKKGVEEGGVMKSIQRGLKGWQGSSHLDDIQDYIRNASDKTLVRLYKDPGESPYKQTPRDIQIKLINRELKRRYGIKPGEQGVAEGEQQVYKVVALTKSNALAKPTKMKVKADSIEEVFERLAANDWYPLEINGVEVIAGKRLKQGVAEGSSQQFDMNLAKILKKRGYKGPVKLEQLGMKWVEAIGDVVDIDDYIMVQGKDPDYDGWVSYVYELGQYAYGAEEGYTTGTAKRVEIDTRVDEGISEGWGQREFEVNGYVYMTEIDEEEDNRKIFHMLKTPEGKTIDVDFTPYAYMTKDDVELYIKLSMPKRQGVGPLDSKQLQKMAQIKGIAMLDPKMARAGMQDEGIGGTIVGGIGQFFGNKIDPLAGEIMRAHGEIAGRKAEYTIRKYMHLLQKALKQQLDSGGKNDETTKEGRRDYGYDDFGNSLRPGHDEGNTEPPNNFAIYINGKKWKVFQGKGQYADDQYEMQQFRQLQSMAARKSQETGKKWEVYRTGEAATK